MVSGKRKIKGSHPLSAEPITVGSVCSGIEGASVAWKDLGFEFRWFSEIAPFPTNVLSQKFPEIPNVGDMRNIPDALRRHAMEFPDLICGGTPCQAFSLAGWKKGLSDDRGNLTLKFVDIIEANDATRQKNKLEPSMVLWENVEGVLSDKTNAFGCFVASLAGLKSELPAMKWPNAGIIHGPKRNIAWRVLDAKYFGVPQQRRRLYLLAGGKDFYPENVLFDRASTHTQGVGQALTFTKNGHSIEVFRHYTDCLYAAYGTKWNGNAAAYNGSLFVVQNGRLRRFTPRECERLMGFPDDYTLLQGARPTNRYQAVGNSWAIPVIAWIGKRLQASRARPNHDGFMNPKLFVTLKAEEEEVRFYPVRTATNRDGQATLEDLQLLNGTEIPENPTQASLADIIDTDASENFYITPVGCKGILRRKEERKLNINPRLERALLSIASHWPDDEIEKISRKQQRGKFGQTKTVSKPKEMDEECAA